MGSRLVPVLVLAALLGAVAPEGRAADPSPSRPAEPPLSGCRWEALARRGPGRLVGTTRWNAGTLAVRDEKLIWVDARDPGLNLIVPLSRVTGHSLVCLGPGNSSCTEWRLRTRREEYRFRDLASGRDGSARLTEIHDHVRSVLSDPPAAP
jgi:hypothetical protein